MESNNNLIQWLSGLITISSEKYLPYSKSGLMWNEYQNVATTNSIIKKCIKLKQANVGANGWKVESKMFRSQIRNEAIEWKVYQLLESLNIEELFRAYSAQLGIFGNSILTFNDEHKPVLHSPSLYNLYFSTLEQKSKKYALVIDGREQKGDLGNLQEGVDLYHFKNPDSSYKPWADSPIDACYSWILLYQHALEAGNQLASRGWVNVVGLLPETDKDTTEYFRKKDDKGKTMAQTLAERLRDWFGGSKNSGKIAILDRIREVVEIGSTKEANIFVKNIDNIVEQIIHPYGFTLSDMGKDVTYNNASTFNYAQYDIVGRAEERQFEHALNTFVLPRILQSKESMGLLDSLNSGDLYFKFESPKDPDEQANIQLHLNILEKMISLSDSPEYKAKLINEFRDKLDMDPIDESMLVVSAPVVADNTLATKPKENFANSIRTPIEKALSSREFLRDQNGVKKGYLPHWNNKITEQITSYADLIVKKNSISEVLATIETDFPKITQFYKKKDIKKDLLVFAEIGYKTFLEETSQEKFGANVPDYINQSVTDRVNFLLGDDPKYKGINIFTMETIKTLIENNVTLGINDLVALIISNIPHIAEARSTVIAEAEVSYQVENARFLGYQNAGYKWKRWLTVSDSRVRVAHRENEIAGIIPIDKPFPNGNMKAGEDVRCRCSTIYGINQSDIQD